MPYSVQLPDGRIVDGIPDDMPQSEARKKILESFPDIAAKEKRGWGEAATDIGASLVSGVGQLAQLPGQIGKLTGITQREETPTGLEGIGKQLETFGQESKSAVLKGKEAMRAQKVSQADGMLAEFGTSIKETLKDPALLTSFFAEQAPNLLGSWGGGLIARGATKALMTGATEAAIGKAGLRGAIGTGAIQQGADIGSDTYETIYKQLGKQYPEMDDEERNGIALAKARVAALEATFISLGTAKLPGGATIEQALAGQGIKGGAKGFIKGLTQEAFSESLEEGAGKFASNVGVQEVFPETSLTKGIGEAAGMGALGGGLFGGVAGSINSAREDKQLEATAAVEKQKQDAIDAIESVKQAEDQARRDAFEAEQTAIRLRAIQEEAPERFQQSEAYAELEAKVEKAKAAMTKADQAKTAYKESAFHEAYPDLLGDILPTESIEQPTQEVAAPIAQPGQMELPLGNEQGQLNLPGMPAAEAPAPEAPVVEARPITAQDIKAMGIGGGPNVKIKQAILGKDLTDPKQAAEVKAALEDYASGDRSAKIIAGVESFLKQPAFYEQEKLKLRRPYGSLKDVNQNTPGVQEDVGGTTTPVAGADEPGIRLPSERQIPAEQPKQAQRRGMVPAGSSIGEPVGGEVAVQRPLEVAPVPEVPTPRVRPKATPTVSASPFAQMAQTLAPEEKPVLQETEPSKGMREETVDELLNRVGVNQFNIDLTPEDLAAPKETPAKAPKAVKAGPISGTTLQQNKEFARRMGYVSTVGGHRLKGAVNKRMIEAAEKGDIKQVLDILGKSKSPIYRQIASIARNVKGLKIAVDETKIEKKFSKFKQGVDSAKITIANIDALREAKRRVDAGEKLDTVAKTIIQFPRGLTPDVKFDQTLASTLFANNALFDNEKFYAYVAEQEAMLEGYEESNRYAAGTPVEVEAIPGLYDPETNTIYLDPYFGKYEDVLAHELTHAISHDFVSSPRARNTPTYKALDKLYQHVLGKFSDKDAYGLSSLDEFVSEGLSNPLFQKELSNIKYENTTAWNKFVQSIAKILGLKPDNALTELLNLTTTAAEQGQSTTRTGKPAFLIQPAALEANYAATGGKNRETPSEKTGAFQTIKDTAQSKEAAKSAVNRFLNTAETMLFSSDAALNNAIRAELESNKTNWDTIKQMMLDVSTSQATHSDAVAMQFLQTGNLEYDEKLHKWVAKEDKNSWSAMVHSLSDLAKKYGLSFDQMEKYAQEAFVSERLKGLSKSKQEVYSHMTPAQIDAGVKFFDMIPELRDIQKQWNAVRKNSMDVAIKGGLYNEKQAKDLLDIMDYVPFYRIEQLAQHAGPKEYGRGLIDFAKGYKIKGSEQGVANIFDNMERWTSYTVSRAVKNRTALSLYNTAKTLFPDEVTDLRIDERTHREQNTIDLWVDGNRRRVEFKDPLFVHAFQGIESAAIPHFGIASSVANFLRKNIVLMPLFSISQLSQDSFGAMLTSGLKHPWGLPLEVAKEFYKTLKGTSTAAKELTGIGAVGVRDYSATFVRDSAEILAGLKAETKTGKVMGALEKFAMASDNAVRQAIYNMTMKETGDKATAMERAFEIINFKRAGASGKVQMLRQVVPFFGAYLQAQNVIYKTLAGKGITPQQRKEAHRILASNALKIGALAFMYAALASDDDDYQNMDPAIRDRHLIIPGTSFMLPLRSDLTLMPKLIAEYTYLGMTDNAFTDGKKIRRAMSDSLKNAVLSPTVAPQAIKPLLEVATNYNFFTGRSIVGQGIVNKITSKQYTNNTSELAKLLGSAGIVAPVNIDHLIKGYFGTSGGLGLMATNAILNADSAEVKPEKSWRDAIASTPGLSTFVSREYGNADKNDFYELRGEFEKINNTFNDMKKRGRIEEAKDLLEENKAILALKPQINNINNQLTKLRDYEKQVYESTKMDAEQKGAEIKRIRDMEQKMLANVHKLRVMAGY